jgi:hypothetical protein
LAVVDRLPFCYVRVPDGVARRTIATRSATRELLEFTRGPGEGEPIASRFVVVDGPLLKTLKQGRLEGRDSSSIPVLSRGFVLRPSRLMQIFP